MSKNNIRLTRIDNRLIHGQIVGEWAATAGANLLVVADDTTAASELDQMVMKTAADSLGYDSRFFTIKKTIEVIEKASSDQKILLLVKTPADLKKIIEGGVGVEVVNIGNLHFSEGKKAIGTKVYVDDKDIKDLDFIKKHVNEIYIQDLPGMKKEKY